MSTKNTIYYKDKFFLFLDIITLIVIFQLITNIVFWFAYATSYIFTQLSIFKVKKLIKQYKSDNKNKI